MFPRCTRNKLLCLDLPYLALRTWNENVYCMFLQAYKPSPLTYILLFLEQILFLSCLSKLSQHLGRKKMDEFISHLTSTVSTKLFVILKCFSIYFHDEKYFKEICAV